MINPLMPYLALIATFLQRFQKDTGVGNVIAFMLSYAPVLIVVWTALLLAWYGLGLPSGLSIKPT